MRVLHLSLRTPGWVSQLRPILGSLLGDLTQGLLPDDCPGGNPKTATPEVSLRVFLQRVPPRNFPRGLHWWTPPEHFSDPPEGPAYKIRHSDCSRGVIQGTLDGLTWSAPPRRRPENHPGGPRTPRESPRASLPRDPGTQGGSPRVHRRALQETPLGPQGSSRTGSPGAPPGDNQRTSQGTPQAPL